MISNAAFATCRPTNERARFAPQPSRLIGRHDRSAAFHPARSDSCALPAVNPSPRSGGFLLAWFYDPPRLETPIARVERQSRHSHLHFLYISRLDSRAMRPDGPRDPVAGPESGPEPPFPIRLSGPVIKGFGRGSKEVCLHHCVLCFL